ncbi:DNA helicase-2 / ATP-dependent DNA helicase PcrA [Halobacillus dabanensis]|uniref:DNA 3'-5' helicase n=1 Tax=Halobacillus dabanensis TaxID=240302 RepID=A0A1I3U3J2_HALDA|nr:ATP-dependent helicase [Halobacillus dabanensis]SFJ76456.1 DNA helicase-2 / ATP-dependent DNA helicase PcrA [Halobacillus dabanensis]
MNFFEQMEKQTGVRLNEVQKQAVLHTDGPLLLLASPGSGKTTTLNMKIGYLLLEKKVKADRIMAITFSKASAQDMSERFDQFFSNITNEKVHFSTIHSFAFKVVREWFRNNRQDFQLIEGNISEEELKKGWNGPDIPLHKKFILKKLYEDTNGTQMTDDEIDELMTYISFVKNRMIGQKELAQVPCNVKNASSIYQSYEGFKENHHGKLLLDFDDMLTYCHRILLEDAKILSNYQQQYAYILTDESQDNSVVQHEIVELLSKPQNNLCVVADDDQSIFMWRGSDVTKLLQFEKTYPDGAVMTMSQNYRSSQEIVKASNQFIKRNKNRYEKEMFTDNASHKPVELKSLSNYEEQLQYVCEEINKSAPGEEVAVLYRNNSSAVPLADKLDKAGIRFYMKDIDAKFFKHWIVEDMLNFMRFSYNDRRVDILERIHTKFNAYISKQQIEYLKKKNDQTSVFDTLLKRDLPDYQSKNIKQAKKLFKDINEMQPAKAIRTIREKLGYDHALNKMCEKFGFNSEHLFSILDTLEKIAEGLGSLKGFADRLKELETLIQTSKFNKHKSSLTLTTFHSAKGLEYDKVYMIDLINGVIPSKDDMETYRNKDTGPMEEAVRLFYVGMTRARKNLELLTYNYKGKERVTESIFVMNVRRIVQPAGEKKNSKKRKRPTADLSDESLLTIDEVELGKMVEHRTFGAGVIKAYGGDQIGIQFAETGYKELLLEVCLDNGLLRKAKEEV